MKISLVIPCNTDTRRIVCRTIKKMGFICTDSKGERHTYIKDEDGPVEIIVLDWESSKTGNAKVKEKLKTLKRNKEVFVLLCKGREEKRQLEQALGSSDGEKYLLKTFDMNSLTQIIMESQRK